MHHIYYVSIYIVILWSNIINASLCWHLKWRYFDYKTTIWQNNSCGMDCCESVLLNSWAVVQAMVIFKALCWRHLSSQIAYHRGLAQMATVLGNTCTISCMYIENKQFSDTFITWRQLFNIVVYISNILVTTVYKWFTQNSQF